MNAVQPKQYIHYNPERTDYSVTPEELIQIETAGSNLWKDVCLVAAPLGVSCIINAIANAPNPLKFTLPLFLNWLVGLIGIFATAVFAIAWWRTRSTQKTIFDHIKQKPKMEIIPNTTDIGPIPQTALQKSPEAGE
jgi:hypothetical protein